MAAETTKLPRWFIWLHNALSDATGDRLPPRWFIVFNGRPIGAYWTRRRAETARDQMMRTGRFAHVDLEVNRWP